MNIRKFIVGLLIATSAMPSFAYESGEWTSVTQIYAKNDGAIFVYFGANAMPGCYQGKAGYIKGANVEKLYSTILAAFMAGKSIKPLYHINAANSGWGLCFVEAVYLKN